MKCLECDKETNNPKFCSRSCAACYNNKIYPKRKVKAKKYCKLCKIEIFGRIYYCNKCKRIKSIKEKSIGEIKKGNANQYGYPMIRQDSRRTYIKSGKEMKCKMCEYSYHVDICHIKDIKDFSDDTLVKEINDISNLVALCKNHHYEFDKGDLLI